MADQAVPDHRLESLGQGGHPAWIDLGDEDDHIAVLGGISAVATHDAEYFCRARFGQIDLWLTPEAEAGLMQAQCLKEKLYPPDIARMVLWLASDDSRLVTAQNFVVDGGRM